MVGIMFIFLLAIFGYFGYVEGKKILQKYLDARLEQMKEFEAQAAKALVSTAVGNAGPIGNMPDAQFKELMDRNFVDWAKSRGILR
jgi:hypothetical protein